MKTINECIEYLNKRITNNQNIIEVSYFNSILYYLQISNNKETLTQAEIDALLKDCNKNITIVNDFFYEKYGYKKSDKQVNDIEDDYIVSTEEKERLLRNIRSDDIKPADFDDTVNKITNEMERMSDDDIKVLKERLGYNDDTNNN